MRPGRSRGVVTGGAERIARAVLVVIPVVAALGAGCFGERFYDLGENHPPNTIFLDAAPYTTPSEDTLITDEAVSLYWRGTDQQDGDAIRWFYYRIAPPDTGWVQTSAGHITLGNLLDTTYTVQVYAVDDRGAADPEPAIRRFRVDVTRWGHLVMETPWISERTDELVFNYRLEGSEFAYDDYEWFMHLVDYVGESPTPRFDYGRQPLVVDNPDDPQFRLLPEPGIRYCLSLFAYRPGLVDSLEERRCFLVPAR